MDQREPHQINPAGQCPRCLRKPMLYKRQGSAEVYPYLFCDRCSRAYSMTGAQVSNWAWKRSADGFQPKYPQGKDANLPMKVARGR